MMTEQLRTGRPVEDSAITKLAGRMQGLTSEDMMALNQLSVVHRFVRRGRSLVSEGEHVSRIRIVCSGWAMRCVEVFGEKRQILDFVLPGDIVGLRVDGRQVSTCDVVAQTSCEVGEIESRELDLLAKEYPRIGGGLRLNLIRELVFLSDQVVRVGRMTAYERVCHFLMEIFDRQQKGVWQEDTVDFPITQTVVADALGLSVVHVNRQVMRLRREGLVTLNRRSLTVHDPQRLSELGGFRSRWFDHREEFRIETAAE